MSIGQKGGKAFNRIPVTSKSLQLSSLIWENPEKHPLSSAVSLCFVSLHSPPVELHSHSVRGVHAGSLQVPNQLVPLCEMGITLPTNILPSL